MSLRQENPNSLVPIHTDNVWSKDWIIILEASTIVGPSADKLRVARTTQDRKIVRRFQGLRRRSFLVIDGYDPRIHTLYFCPQLYKYDGSQKLVPLQGDEIGGLIAEAIQDQVKARRPWYDPSGELPNEPLIGKNVLTEFDTLVVEKPKRRPALVAPPNPGAA
jgi:hypothetical protein